MCVHTCGERIYIDSHPISLKRKIMNSRIALSLKKEYSFKVTYWSEYKDRTNIYMKRNYLIMQTSFLKLSSIDL